MAHIEMHLLGDPDENGKRACVCSCEECLAMEDRRSTCICSDCSCGGTEVWEV